ncbi:MAG: winged helix-turn-helix transcriptional regulator [Chloroflexi bacterium]|jgi:ArsR family transcriptional regulator|nr:winged helix-turn-helix transcriptional regulator [Chloroflexota bacterium]
MLRASCLAGHPPIAQEPISPVPTPARIRSTLASLAAPPDDLRDVAVYHKAMADPTRLRILRRLAHSPGTVTELIGHVDLSQPLVSWHLRRLKAAGLIEMERNGREVICSLRRDALALYQARERALLGPMGPVDPSTSPA